MKQKAKLVAIVCCVLVSILVQRVNAQSSINGVIINENNEPLPNATVLLLHAKDSSLVKGTLTNVSGRYTFQKIAQGNYILSASFSHLKQVFSPAFLLVDKIETTVEALQLSERKISCRQLWCRPKSLCSSKRSIAWLSM